MKPKFKKALYIAASIIIFWTLVTLWAQYGGKQKTHSIGNSDAPNKALIVYNPDPIYNLDEQVCNSFAEGLAARGFVSEVSTVKNVPKPLKNFDLYVFCANTYNYAPDWRLSSFITSNDFAAKNVVAITLGSGSTERSQRVLEALIKSRLANLLASKTYWLLRPNDESRLQEKNVEVATDMARKFGEEIGKQLSK